MEPLATETPTVETFPQELTLSLTVKLSVADAEEKNLYIEKETGAVALTTLADLFDILADCGWCVTSINNLTHAQIRAAFASHT